MLLTLYYMYATLIQWWRIGRTRAKISDAVCNNASLVLYKRDRQPAGTPEANLQDVLFYADDKVGCTMVPKKRIQLNKWIPYCPCLSTCKTDASSFTVVLHADVDDFYRGSSSHQLQISDLGDPVAWSAMDNFGVLIRTDLDKFAKLVSCFLSTSIAVNDGMEVYQIETIDIEGEFIKPEIDNAFKKFKWPKLFGNQEHWNSVIRELKDAYKKTIFSNQPTCNGIHETKEEIVKSIKPEALINITEKPHENHTENVSKHKTKISESKEKKTHKKIDKQNCSVEKPREKSGKESKNKMKSSTSQEKIKISKEHIEKHKNSKELDKHKSNKDSHKSKREKMVKKHSSDRLLVKETSDQEKKVETIVVRKPFIKTKPPNVLVYADSLETRENVKKVLKDVLNINKYTIYELNPTTQNFADNSTLVVICGSVHPNLTSQFLQYFLNGGHLLCLCSDFLNSVLQTFTTAEVREHELVRFSYGEWKRVRMMHHIFCYQASPAKKHFSQDSDQNSSGQSSGNSPIAPRTPSIVEIQLNNKTFAVQVQVLGTEETWHTPSILFATVKNGSGKAVFSQVHLEIDPTQYEDDQDKYVALKESNSARLDILKDILSMHLKMDCTSDKNVLKDYAPGYFLGRHELKTELLSELTELTDNKLQLSKLDLQFCGKGVDPPSATSSLLPILLFSCPEHFSTVEYFENLQTQHIGRLVIYSDVMTSSMDVLNGSKFKHGIVVIPRQQTRGKGRSNNVWLSPVGCAMFTVRLQIPTDKKLAQSLSLVQHLASVAVVSAVRSIPGYEGIDIGLKWPNDIYAESSIKIGGLIAVSTIDSNVATCDIGCGVNLNNSLPTVSINSIIIKHNEINGTSLKTFKYEQFLALVFTELEKILNKVLEDDLEYLYNLYYKYWLHSNSNITVQTANGETKEVTISGIDQYGFLVVCSKDGVTSSVEPDGNTFDMMQGLIAPKIH